MTLLPHLLFVLLLAAGTWVVYRNSFFESALLKWQLLSFFLLKVFAGWLLTWYYMTQTADLLKADVYKYFYDANVLHQLLWERPIIWLQIFFGINTTAPDVFTELNKTEFYFSAGNHWISDDRLMLRIQMVIRLFSMGSVYIHSLVFSCFSFAAAFWCWRKLQHYLQLPVLLSAVVVMALPSVLFWCSAAVKDTLLATGFMLITGCLLNITLGHSKQWQQYVLLVLSLLLMLLLRPLVPVLFVGSIAVAKLLTSGKRVQQYAALLLAVGGLAFFLFNDGVAGLLINKRNELIEVSIRANAGSLSTTNYATPDHRSLIALLPTAFYDAVVQPTPFSEYGWAARFFGLEMWLTLLLLFLSIMVRQELPGLHVAVVSTCLLFALTLLIVVGITSPVIGTSIRYRALAMPCLALSTLLLFKLNLSISKVFSVLILKK